MKKTSRNRTTRFEWRVQYALCAMALVLASSFACRENSQDRAKEDLGGGMIRTFSTELEHAIWQEPSEDSSGFNGLFKISSYARSMIEAVRDMGATQVRLVVLKTAVRSLSGQNFDMGIEFIVTPEGILLQQFAGRPIWAEGADLAAERKEIERMAWPNSWRSWIEAAARVWDALVTEGRPLPSVVSRTEASSVLPATLVESIAAKQSEMIEERDGVRRWCERRGADGCEVKIVPRAVGFLASKANGEPIALLSLDFGMGEDGRIEAYSAGIVQLAVKR